MFGFSRKSPIVEIDAPTLAHMIADGTVLVVDVRERDEFATGHIAGAINQPLSSFDPARLPHPGGKTLVLNCAGGVRSAKALNACASAGAAIDTHLRGGIGAWRAAGLPIVQGA